MQLPTAIPILLALGVRIFIILINPNHTPTTTDHILVGLWQGVALYHTLKHIPSLVLPVGIGIAGKLLYDFSNTLDTTKCACVLLGVASGVLVTDILAQLFEHGRYNEVEREPITPSSPHRPSKRLRLVSFERTTHKEKKERPSRHKAEAERARAQAASPAPTNAYSVDTAITLDSLPSSIDPDNRMSPAEREVAMLRARASLADSERRRFKEERKWALSQGNTARAEQLGWQVKRYSALMESYHREADAKVVEGPSYTNIRLLDSRISVTDDPYRFSCSGCASTTSTAQPCHPNKWVASCPDISTACWGCATRTAGRTFP